MQSHHTRSEHRESLVSSRNYKIWGQTISQLAKTPSNLEKPRAEYSDLEIAGYVLQEHREDVIRLWEAFTTDRQEVSRYLMDPKRESMVYLLGFHLANQARLASVLDRAEFRHKLLSQLSAADAVHLMDLGCGSGALSLLTAQELWSYREALDITWEMVDKSAAFLEMAAHGIKLLKEDARPVLRRQKLDEYLSREVAAGAKDGLVWYQLGYVWNEVSRHARTTQLLMRLLEAGLKKGQRVITILEPASQELAREAMELRDQLVDMGYVMLYPCPHSQACPMLESQRDWCYSEAVWDRPPLVKKVDRILKIDRQRIGVSAYVFVSPDLIEDGHVKLGNKEGSVVVGRPVERASRDPMLEQKSYLLCAPEVSIDKVKASRNKIELLRGQIYRDMPDIERKPKAADGERRAPQKARNPNAVKKAPFKKKDDSRGDRKPAPGKRISRKRED